MPRARAPGGGAGSGAPYADSVCSGNSSNTYGDLASHKKQVGRAPLRPRSDSIAISGASAAPLHVPSLPSMRALSKYSATRTNHTDQYAHLVALASVVKRSLPEAAAAGNAHPTPHWFALWMTDRAWYEQ